MKPLWWLTKDGDLDCLELYERHYSCYRYADGRKRTQFVGPGEKVVLRTERADALFVWRKYIDDSGQQGINCAVFRNEGSHQSSLLIRQADQIADCLWPDSRHYTYVNGQAIRSTNPGYCFLKAGWERAGYTKSGLLILARTPLAINRRENMLAFHGDKAVKAKYLQRVTLHEKADEIVHGRYWENGKGCAVGCTIHGSDHMAYERELGIPVALARLQETLFEGMANGDSKTFPRRFLAAIRPGADLSLVQWKFLHLLQVENHKFAVAEKMPGDVISAIKQCVDVLAPMTKGESVNKSAARSAESAARSAESAKSAESAAWSARSVESAAWSAESAKSAESAAWSARSAESAAWSAKSAESAAWSARSAESAAYKKMADTLLALLKAA